MTQAFQTERNWLVAAAKSITLQGRREPELTARLEDPAADCSFEELHFDSLGRMELCIWLQMEVGVEIDESVILAHPSVNRLAR